jgi:hypothetical protein
MMGRANGYFGHLLGAVLLSVFCLTAKAYGADQKFALSFWQDERLYDKVTMTPVTEHGLVAELYQPKGQHRPAAILTLGACTLHSPRDLAQGLANEGYVTLALFYCGPKNGTDILAAVPLEYMKTAIDWLLDNPDLGVKRVGDLSGGHRGSRRGAKQSGHPGFGAGARQNQERPQNLVLESARRARAVPAARRGV